MSDVHCDDATDDLTDAWLVDVIRDDTESDSDVERLISSISSGLRRVRRPARTLAADARGVAVSDRVVKQQIAVGIRRSLGRLVVFASVDGTDDRVDGVRIGLIARYGDDIPALSDRVRDLVEDVLVSTIGVRTSAAARADVSVRWQDLYTREWLD
ncbi:hypothetical protein [Gordonia humi]|uniref:Asp23/Gls24 family envelope stress response protein n=1 Tax=Gordonia humi TaxID=686429 RepID=A0A840ER37_9ACTN|nr:hypothetical protein [Gordonia humi]MBB4134172.1 hypothetical protein [Gordonia humi]